MNRLVVCISGGGTTLHNLWEHADRDALAGEIVGVFSSRQRGAVNESIFAECERRGVPCTVVRPADHAGDFAVVAAREIGAWHPDLVLLAGYLVRWHIPEQYIGRVLNIHPALLPKYGGQGYYGRRVHEAVLAAGDTESGCTVHFADNEYDHGPIVLQRRVKVHPDDTPETLQARVFEQECEVYPEAIAMLADGRARYRNGTATTTPPPVA